MLFHTYLTRISPGPPAASRKHCQGDYANKTYLDTLPLDTLFAYAWLYWGKTKASRLTPKETLGSNPTLLISFCRMVSV